VSHFYLNVLCLIHLYFCSVIGRSFPRRIVQTTRDRGNNAPANLRQRPLLLLHRRVRTLLSFVCLLSVIERFLSFCVLPDPACLGSSVHGSPRSHGGCHTAPSCKQFS